MSMLAQLFPCSLSLSGRPPLWPVHFRTLIGRWPVARISASRVQCRLHVFRAANDRTLHFRPIYALVELLVYQANCADIVAADKVQAQRDLGGGFLIVWLSDDALCRIT